MTVPELNEAGIDELSQLADARYYDWHARELRPEQDRQIKELDSQKVSEGGRALLALRVTHDLLTRTVQGRISIYEAVGREKTCWAMFSKRRLDHLRQRIMHFVGASIESLKSRSQRAANAVGQSAPLHEKRYENVRAEVLTAVNTGLAKLEAEGRVAIHFPDRRVADSADRHEGLAVRAFELEPLQRDRTESTGIESTLADFAQSASELATKGRRRGPTRMKPEKLLAFAAIVECEAPDGNWRSNIDAVCYALDDAGNILFPSKWRKDDKACRVWSDQRDRPKLIKNIEYRLDLAKSAKKATPETLS